MKILCFLFSWGIWVGIVAEGTERLLCFECTNAPTNDACLRNGKVMTCQPNERACSTEIRRETTGTKRMKISKRCKQALACENNYWQNVGGTRRNSQSKGRQCAGESGLPFTSTICRCCCGTPLCNAGLYSTCLNAQLNVKRDEVQVIAPRKPVCPPIEMEDGRKRCSRYNQAGSHCRFQCNRGYLMFGPQETSCQKIDGYNVKWTQKPPCCAKQCPPYGSADILIGLQSNVRSSAEWMRIKFFITSLIRPFMQRRDSDANIGLFAFNDKTDRRREIYLRNGYKNRKVLTELIRGVVKTKFFGVNFERALRHVQRISLTPSRGDRYQFRDVILLVTYGNSFADHSRASIPARQLRDDGVKIYILNIQPRGGRITGNYLRNFENISGSRDSIFVVNNGLQVRNSVLSGRIRAAICGDPCERNKPIIGEEHFREFLTNQSTYLSLIRL